MNYWSISPHSTFNIVPTTYKVSTFKIGIVPHSKLLQNA